MEVKRKRRREERKEGKEGGIEGEGKEGEVVRKSDYFASLSNPLW